MLQRCCIPSGMQRPNIEKEILQLLPTVQKMTGSDELVDTLEPLEELGNDFFDCRLFLVLKRDDQGRLRGQIDDFQIDLPVLQIRGRDSLFLEGDEAQKYGVDNVLLLPFHSAQLRLLGALAFVDVPSDASLESTESVSTVAALAVQHARLLKRQRLQDSEMRHAWSVVRTLLPLGQRDWGEYQFAGLLIPARHIGGDAYDYFPIDDTKFGFLIGDATGKGVGPCLQVSTCRAYYRALAHALSDLKTIAHKLNELLNDDVRSDSFVTACFGWVCSASNTLTYVNAGHSESFVRDTNGTVIPIAEADPPLGILKGVSFQVHQQALEPGALWAFFTDGWTERPTEDGQYGEERLCLNLTQTLKLGSRDSLRAVYQRYESECLPAQQTDDVTALFIHRIPQS